MAYNLRRLIRKGLIERLPRSHRYRLTDLGRQLILFCAKLHTRVLCSGLRQLDLGHPPNSTSPGTASRLPSHRFFSKLASSPETSRLKLGSFVSFRAAKRGYVEPETALGLDGPSGSPAGQ